MSLKAKEYKPTTIAEKLRIKMAIQFLVHQSDSTPEGEALYIRYQKLLDTLTSWCHSLGKSIAIQRQEHSTKVVEEIPFTEEPDDLFDNEDVNVRLQQAIKNLETGNRAEDENFLTAYCAAKIVYSNGQRPGVIENVTTEEFLRRHEHQSGKMVITCQHHKTGVQGAAQLVVDKFTDELLDTYYRLVRQRVKAHEGTHHLFFLTFNGRRYTQVYRKIQEAITNIIKDTVLPAPSQYRRVVRTDASQALSDNSLRNLAKHMCHSSETVRQYYEFSDISGAISAHTTITDMAKRRQWSTQETETLLKAWPLEKPRPDLKSCAFIKEKYNLPARTPKNIQDKWRQLKEKEQRK